MLALFVVTVAADKFQRKSFGFLHIKPPKQRDYNSCRSLAGEWTSKPNNSNNAWKIKYTSQNKYNTKATADCVTKVERILVK